MERIQLTLRRASGRRLHGLFAAPRRFVALTIATLVCSIVIILPVFVASGNIQKGSSGPVLGSGEKPSGLAPSWSQAVAFVETKRLSELKPDSLTPEQAEKIKSEREEREKNEQNTRRVKRDVDPKKTQAFTDPAINNFKHDSSQINAVTNPIQNFDGPDADTGAPLFGTRFAPPDTNAAVGPNHVIAISNMGLRVYDKAGNPLTAQFRLSTLLAGIPNAADDDGDPIVVYDSLSDRWILSQFNLRVTNNSTHEHIAISKTGDPTGAYYAYDFLLTAFRPGDYPHMGVWSDGYYMSTNDFSLPVFSPPFQGAGLYAFERSKMLVGDPTAKIIAFNTNNMHGGMLPSNLQGFTPPPVGTPNLFFEWDADEFGAPTDLIRAFIFHADFNTPANSTLTQGPDIPTIPFDGRSNFVQQPAPGENLDALADRLMHALNFRVLPGGIQSYVLNWTVNVSGVNPTSVSTYQAGVRWMELRRNPGTGAVTINQQATYAPSSGNGTGRDIWMAAVAQDGEGNIALGASATNSTATPTILNPTAIYTGRLAGDPPNTLPQSEVDALVAVPKGLQLSNTFNRWGDYSSMFVDPADECTFWGAFEYVDTPNASFDWNTRVFSFKVNPTCVTAPRGTINGTITNCISGQPILNALITTPEGFARQSDASGQFSMTVAPGTYTVTVSGPPGSGFGTCTQMVTVAAGGTATVNCCLQPAAIIVSAGATLISESCTPANGVLDPGETVTVSLCVQNTGGADTTNLVGTLQATGGVVNPSGPQTYGVVVAGGPPVCRNFTFTVSGTCGGTITATLQLQDGATNLGSVTYTFSLGVLNVAFSEDFDGVTPPALPAGWVTAFTNGAANCTPSGTCALGSNWTTVNTTPDTAPNAAFHNDPSCVTDNVLDTPSINITSTSAQVTFRNNFNLESTFDGGVLEVSSPNINGGAFTDITNAAVGGNFVAGGYNATISVNFLSPIAGRPAWSGNSSGYITTTANLGPNVAGQTIKLRFRVASDCSVSATGWLVDTVRVTDGLTCCSSGVTPCVLTCPANITVSNDPDQCGAVVTYPPPTSTGTCGTITCTPPSGSFFPVGTTTVTCTASGASPIGQGPSFVPTETKTASTGGVQTGKVGTTGGIITGARPTTSNTAGGGSPKAPSAPVSPFAVLYSQLDSPAPVPGGVTSQNFEAAFDAFDTETADDFVVPAGVNWTVDQVFVVGEYTTGPAASVNVVFYSDSSMLPGSVVATRNAQAFADVGGDFTITLSPTVVLSPGTYWVGVQANQDFGTAGQWFWDNRLAISNAGAAWRNPGGGFGVGCTSFGRKTTCLPTQNGPDQLFQILGTSAPIAGGTTCTFTVTVNDTQPPTITCPTNVTAVTDQNACPAPPCVVVNYPPPTASDNCPGVVVVCNPPSGSCFPTGVTTVTCTATDASGNTATCSFTVTTFDTRLQDDSDPSIVLLWNSTTGAYRFCCNGTTYTGVGKSTIQGCVYTLQHNPADRRVLGRVDKAVHSGTASLQAPPGKTRCTITDRNTLNDTGTCQ